MEANEKTADLVPLCRRCASKNIAVLAGWHESTAYTDRPCLLCGNVDNDCPRVMAPLDVCLAVVRRQPKGETAESQPDAVEHPAHYTKHPSGIECIEVTEHLNFCLGSAVKYIWRADLKWDAIEDLKKAAWFINREIERRLKQ